MLHAFHSALIEVDDFQTAVADYARLLGQEPAWLEEVETQGLTSALFPLANMMLEIRTQAARSSKERLNALGDEDVSVRADRDHGLVGMRLSGEEAPALAEMLEQRRVPTGGLACLSARRVEEEGRESVRSWSSISVAPEASRGIAVELVADETGDRPLTPRSTCDPNASIAALDHVVVLSADIEATRDFYAQSLGIRLALDRSFEKRGVRLLFFRIGGTTIEIGGRLGQPPKPGALDRFGGLAWQVPDVDAIRSRLLADRFDVSEVRDGNKPGTRVCTVRDPVHAVPTLLIEPVR